MKTITSTRIEALESRIAPAALVISGPHGRTATFTDVDGDAVTVTTSKGTFTPSHFQFGPQNGLGGQQLQVLDLLANDNQAQFNNADITFSVVHTPGTPGDGEVNLGYLKGSSITHPTTGPDVIKGVDLKTFTLPGDIGKIMLGDRVQSVAVDVGGFSVSPKFSVQKIQIPIYERDPMNPNNVIQVGTRVHYELVPEIGELTHTPVYLRVADVGNTVLAHSVGGAGLTTGAPDFSSVIVGTGSLFVDTNVNEAKIEYFGKYGTCGISVGGSLIGGAGPDSGQIIFHQKGFVVISGSIIGGDGRGSGTIIGGELDYNNPDIQDITGRVMRLELGHDLVGGRGQDSGQVLFAKATTSGRFAGITIQGSIIGGEGERSGLISSLLDIRDLEIGGDIIGGSGNGSGGIHAGQEMLVAGNTQAVQIADEDAMVKGKITTAIIHGSIIGGSNASATQRLDRSGFIEAADIGTLTIEGSVVSGTDAGGGLSSSGSIRADKTITKLWVKGITAFAGQAFGSKGGLIGNATSNVVISAGKTLATLIVGAENTVSAQVLRTEILAGYFHDTTSNVRGDAGNADADITTVRFNGDFVASSIVAGVQAGADGYFGTADDASIVGGTDVRANQSKISSVVIRGLVAGTGSINDHFGIVAESVGSVRVGGALVAGLNSRLNIIDIISATTGDLTVREVI